MNKKGQGMLTGRWMIKNIGQLFFFVIVAGFIYAIVTSFISRDINADDAMSFSVVGSVAECMKHDGEFEMERAARCGNWNEKFGVRFSLNNERLQKYDTPASARKDLCYFTKTYICGKDYFTDKSGDVLTIDWVLNR